MIDIVDANESFTVGDWYRLCQDKIATCYARNIVPIIVGGTHLYVKTLLEGLSTAPRSQMPLHIDFDGVSTDELHKRLAISDPVSAERIHPNDRRRILRALEIPLLSGRPMSEFYSKWHHHTDTGPPKYQYHPIVLSIHWDKERLIERINTRVEQMFNAAGSFRNDRFCIESPL